MVSKNGAPAISVLGDEAIYVVGHNNPYPYSKVKDAVILLGGDYYFRNDEENLVRVKDPSGKKKFFRKKSKLIFEIRPGHFIHRSYLIKTEDGVYLDKSDPDTVAVNGKPTRREYTVEVDGKFYLKSDPKLKKCCFSQSIAFEDDMITLSKKYYPKGAWAHKNHQHRIVTTQDGEMIADGDVRNVMGVNGEIEYYHRSTADYKNCISVFYKFRDATNPQLDRLDFIPMFEENAKHSVVCEELGCRVHKAHLKGLMDIYNNVIVLREAQATAALKKALKYADDGPDENQAKVVKKIAAPYPGKHNIYIPSVMPKIISKTRKRTGGLSYTFGVELETSQGLVPNELAEKVHLKIVGDRSIGAGEYVTGVLHGDDGIALLEQQCKAVARYCLVDDRCGIHVHVGGMKDVKGVADGGFDRHFAIRAIKLGCQIEEALYKTCPDSRQTTLKHCHSIMRWKNIDDKNWREYLGAYVFGPEENWSKPWTFANYKYGSDGQNKKARVDTWCGGRYKWLNLVHILAQSSIGTCELRLFPGSSNFDKIYNYVMMSMAFVWFIENKPGRIEKGDVTLNEVLTAPFARYPELGERLVKFFDSRTKKFARTNLYPASIPKAIL